MATVIASARRYRVNIAASGLTIYDPIRVGDPNLWIPSEELEALLNEQLVGIDLTGLPLRTRSKFVNGRICQALGYPTPTSFRRVRPRFPGQNFDKYVQKSTNLQVWNEEVSPNRRYVVIGVDGSNVIFRVRVATGDTMADLDTTGALTQKYQARVVQRDEAAELVVGTDNPGLAAQTRDDADLSALSPVAYPEAGFLLSIREIYQRLLALLDTTVPYLGSDQERNRGAELHRRICATLGYSSYLDHGQFPDIRHQLLEIKLQTSPTIDLGLVTPSSTEPIDVPVLAGYQVRHCDVRYAVLYGVATGEIVTLTNLYVTTGTAFFTRFRAFGGKRINKKLQIRLPSDFFSE